MSGPSGAGSSGMVRNSALSFVAPAQATNPSVSDEKEQLDQDRMVPSGLKALCDACSQMYPDQQNPLQVTTRLKYWLGGQDPLDYISMYWNPGNSEKHIPPHWHYVSFGLSDLHGDGRVHPPPDRVMLSSPSPPPSGYGFELTFRLAHTGAPAAPPLWPAALMQALARYVFTTGNKFCAGDHITWHAPLDGSNTSRVRHMLVAEDPQLGTVDTPHGNVTFIQMVGCTSRELRAAQRGSGFDVLKLMAEDTNCGGSWLVTRSHRRFSARRVRTARVCQPAELAGVSARLRWSQYAHAPKSNEERASPSQLSPSVERQIKETLERGLSTMSTDRQGPEGHNMSTDSFEMSSMERALPHIPELMQGSWRSEDSVEYMDGVHLVLNAEAASLLPLAIDGRVLHGRHFTWRQGNRAVTFLSPTVAGAFATVPQPYAVKGNWLQVLIPNELARDMSARVSSLSRLADTDSESDEEPEGEAPPTLPFALSWPKYRLSISLVQDLL